MLVKLTLLCLFQDHPSQPGHHTLNQFSSGQITEWNNENVCHWLIGIEMERYAPLFTEKSVTGPQLVAMDSNKLKVLYGCLFVYSEFNS